MTRAAHEGRVMSMYMVSVASVVMGMFDPSNPEWIMVGAGIFGLMFAWPVPDRPKKDPGYAARLEWSLESARDLPSAKSVSEALLGYLSDERWEASFEIDALVEDAMLANDHVEGNRMDADRDHATALKLDADDGTDPFWTNHYGDDAPRHKQVADTRAKIASHAARIIGSQRVSAPMILEQGMTVSEKLDVLETKMDEVEEAQDRAEQLIVLGRADPLWLDTAEPGGYASLADTDPYIEEASF